MKFEMYTHVEFDLDRERIDESLYVIKEELEFDYHIEMLLELKAWLKSF